jgi:DNA invertase Pin-like site-specific DNA recombinase
MIARQLGAVARYESEQTAGRTRAGKADAAARGAWPGGQRVYGYEIVLVSTDEATAGQLRLQLLSPASLATSGVTSQFSST